MTAHYTPGSSRLPVVPIIRASQQSPITLLLLSVPIVLDVKLVVFNIFLIFP